MYANKILHSSLKTRPKTVIALLTKAANKGKMKTHTRLLFYSLRPKPAHEPFQRGACCALKRSRWQCIPLCDGPALECTLSTIQSATGSS